jgi:hypothetical protein
VLKVLPLPAKLLLLLLLPRLVVLVGGATNPASGCSRESTPCCRPLLTSCIAGSIAGSGPASPATKGRTSSS